MHHMQFCRRVRCQASRALPAHGTSSEPHRPAAAGTCTANMDRWRLLWSQRRAPYGRLPVHRMMTTGSVKRAMMRSSSSAARTPPLRVQSQLRMQLGVDQHVAIQHEHQRRARQQQGSAAQRVDREQPGHPGVARRQPLGVQRNVQGTRARCCHPANQSSIEWAESAEDWTHTLQDHMHVDDVRKYTAPRGTCSRCHRSAGLPHELQLCHCRRTPAAYTNSTCAKTAARTWPNCSSMRRGWTAAACGIDMSGCDAAAAAPDRRRR